MNAISQGEGPPTQAVKQQVGQELTTAVEPALSAAPLPENANAAVSTEVGQAFTDPDLIPILVESIDWIGIALIIFLFRKQIFTVLDAISARLNSGSDFGFGGYYLGRLESDQSQLPPEAAAVVEPLPPGAEGEWTTARDQIYLEKRRYYLSYSLKHSREPGHKYRVRITVRRHRRIGSKDLESDKIRNASFFFGRFWENNIFSSKKFGNLIGIELDAYGPFLALCKIELIDGTIILLDKYVDFAGYEESRDISH